MYFFVKQIFVKRVYKKGKQNLKKKLVTFFYIIMFWNICKKNVIKIGANKKISSKIFVLVFLYPTFSWVASSLSCILVEGNFFYMFLCDWKISNFMHKGWWIPPKGRGVEYIFNLYINIYNEHILYIYEHIFMNIKSHGDIKTCPK